MKFGRSPVRAGKIYLMVALVLAALTGWEHLRPVPTAPPIVCKPMLQFRMATPIPNPRRPPGRTPPSMSALTAHPRSARG